MKIFPEQFPKNIPRIFSTFIAANFGVYWMTILIIDELIGRPSSTSILGFFFIPLWTFIFAGLCVWVGRLIRFIVGKFIHERTIEKESLRIINIIFALTVGVSFLAGLGRVIWHEHLQKPQIIYDAGVISKEALSDFRRKEYSPAKFVFTIYKKDKGKTEGFEWNGEKLNLDVSRPHINILRKDGSLMISADLSKYDYIGRIHAAAFGAINKKQKCLALLVYLRATSDRSMLLIYDFNGALIFQELLNRRCGWKTGGMQVGVDESKCEYLFLNVDSPAAYFIKREAGAKKQKVDGGK
ncbi:MAG: hypothetical protein CVU78_07785 [Elusimicrobia bacterium HGW-Elusimicrobia-2]|nr:MAG: hypothetical protein CVU78_07785 [Elusimicrobia bacterium HGW-Elusimicrobia-2]